MSNEQIFNELLLLAKTLEKTAGDGSENQKKHLFYKEVIKDLAFQVFEKAQQIGNETETDTSDKNANKKAEKAEEVVAVEKKEEKTQVRIPEMESPDFIVKPVAEKSKSSEILTEPKKEEVKTEQPVQEKIQEPAAVILKSVNEITEETDAPVTQTLKSVNELMEEAEAKQPVAESIVEEDETNEEVVETPEPVAEIPQPIAETPEPVAEITEPVTETPQPFAETPKPVAEAPHVEETPEPAQKLNVSETKVTETPDNKSVASGSGSHEDEKVRLYEKFTKTHQLHNLADKHAENRITDLTKAISISKKFEFINELFNGNSEEYKTVVNKIEACGSFEASSAMLEKNVIHAFNWNNKEQIATEFMNLVNEDICNYELKTFNPQYYPQPNLNLNHVYLACCALCKGFNSILLRHIFCALPQCQSDCSAYFLCNCILSFCFPGKETE